MAEEQALACPGDPHVGQPSLLRQLVGVTEGTQVGEYAVLHTHDEHRRKLEALRSVHRHEDDLASIVVIVRQVIGVGHQADPLQEVVHRIKPGGGSHQLGQVLQSPLGLDRVLGAQLVEIAGPVEGR